MPSDHPLDNIPFSLHSQHRRFGDPREMELYLTFTEPHRIRYTTLEGVVHDEYIEVKYEFTTVDSSVQFQSDVRRRDLVDWFDVDVVWSDQHRRTDSYGAVRGLGTIQRVKMWRDRYSSCHFISFYANHRRRWKEYLVQEFEPEPRNRDDRHRRLQITVRGGRRGSGQESQHGGRDRRFSASSIFRPRQNAHVSSSQSSIASGSSRSGIDIRYLGFQFTRQDRNRSVSDGKAPQAAQRDVLAIADPKNRSDYARFLDRWNYAHNSEAEFDVPFPTNHIELPSPHMMGEAAELPSPVYTNGGLPVLLEPEGPDSEETP